MPAYKDEKHNTWYCLFYYLDWQGNRKKKQKRGFKSKEEALEWENNYKLSANADMDMTLGDFVQIYFRDKTGELKERSVKNKRYMIEAHIIPYFQYERMNEITPADIIQWQNLMREKGYAQTYLRAVCVSEQIKENNNEIRNLTGEYKKIEPECREGIRERLERMKALCKERNVLYEKQILGNIHHHGSFI